MNLRMIGLQIFEIFVTSIVAGLATYFINHNLKQGGVKASAIVALLAGIFLPYFFPETGKTLAVMAACISYAGMSAVKRVADFREMTVVSIFAVIIFIASAPVYAGVGGKLGTMGCIAVIAVGGVRHLLSSMGGKAEKA